MQTLDERVATQYVLHKHHLLKGSQAESVLQVVNDIIALHATSAETPYLSLFARVKSFQRKRLDEEFYVKRNLVRLEAMRGTLFITSTESAPMLYQATRTPESQRLKRIHKWGMSTSEYHELTEKLQNVLKGGGKTLQEIKKALPRQMVRSVKLKVGKSTYKGTNINLVLNAMMRRGMVISEKGAETFRFAKPNRYLLLHEIYPKLNLGSIGSEEAKAKLVKRYITAFGPVTGEDIAWWTGFSKTDIRKALATMDKELLPVKINGFKGDFLMLETDYAQFVTFKPLRTRPMLLLPFEDPYTKGYKIRDRLIDKEHEKKAYVGGSVQPTILLNGKIAGTWNGNIEEGKGPIKLRFFQKPEKDMEKEVKQKAKAVGKLIADEDVDVVIC